jgi:DNA invertase Pin-like site-specific DNA recombinase
MTCLSSPRRIALAITPWMSLPPWIGSLSWACTSIAAPSAALDLASAASRMPMQVINAVAQLERELLIERTSSGLARAKASGEQLGRPKVLDDKRAAGAHAALKSGEPVSAVAKKFDTSRQTIMRARDAVVEAWSSKEPRGCVMDDGGVG